MDRDYVGKEEIAVGWLERTKFRVAARGGVALRNWSGPYFKIKVSGESEAAIEETANEPAQDFTGAHWGNGGRGKTSGEFLPANERESGCRIFTQRSRRTEWRAQSGKHGAEIMNAFCSAV